MEGIAQRFFWKRGTVFLVWLVAASGEVADHFVVQLMEGVNDSGLAAPHVDVIDFSGRSRTNYAGREHNVP